MKSVLRVTALVALVLAVPGAFAKEFPIGKPHKVAGMEVAAVYLQPIKMEPEGMMRKAEESDIHLEADIHALKGNPNGFEEGAWMPNLSIDFEIVKLGAGASGEKITGHFMPMVASDGPHYGDNVKLQGPGRYKLTLRINSTGSGGHGQFGRHTDKETGVAPWPATFDVSYEFTYGGTGKKGGY